LDLGFDQRCLGDLHGLVLFQLDHRPFAFDHEIVAGHVSGREFFKILFKHGRHFIGFCVLG